MKHMLFMSHCVPFPPDKGDRTRAYHEILALSRHYRLTVAFPLRQPGDASQVDNLRPLCSRVLAFPAGPLALVRGGLSLLTGGSVTQGCFHSSRLVKELQTLAASDPFDAVLAYSSNILPMALAVPAKVHLSDLVDADSAKWAAYAGVSGVPMNWVYRAEARGVAKLERQAVERCPGVFIISQAEAETLEIKSDRIVVAGNGVDLDYFHPADAADEQQSGGGQTLAFVGQMDYPPNVQAAQWFVREVWPALRQRHAGVTLMLIGRNPASEVLALARPDEIIVTGTVPDVRPLVWSASAVVAPLQIARGVPNKVLESLAMGKCVIASAPALQGLELRRGQDVIQAQTPTEWIAAVGRALSDESFRREMQRNARRCVEEHYTWAARLNPLVQRCLAACS